MRDHNLLGGMSRRGNCHDNAVAESFFQLLKRERIRHRIYDTLQDARSDVFDHIKLFYIGSSVRPTGIVCPAETTKSRTHVRCTSGSRPSCVTRSSEPETT